MKRTPISLVASLVGLLTLASLAPLFLYGGPGWRRGGPETATVRSLGVDPSNANIVYLVTQGSVWKSTDAGAHWFPSSKDLCGFYLTQIAVDPTRPANLYVAAGDGVFRSTDAGASWNASDDSLKKTYMTSVAVDPTGHDIVYAGGYYGVSKSTDGGRTWAAQNTGMESGEVTRIVIDPANPSRIYALVPFTGLFRTTNGGANWQSINTGLTTDQVSDLALSGTTLYVSVWSKGAFKSTDSGTSWTPLFPESAFNHFLSIAVHPTDPNIVFAGDSNGQVQKSTDGGAHWQPFDCAPGYYHYTNSIVVHRQNPQTIYAGGDAGFAVSTDGGEHWNARNTGLTGPEVAALLLDDQDPLTWYVGTTHDGLWRTTDSGSVWAPVGQNIPSKSVLAITKVPNGNAIYASYADSGLYKTTDRGNTWVQLGEDKLGNYVADIALTATSSHLYAFNYGVYFSTDGGTTWTKKSTGLPSYPFAQMASDPLDPQVLYVGYYEKGMFKTTNGGETWSEIGSFNMKRIRGFAVDPWDASVIYAGTDGDFYRSTDKGATWYTSGAGLQGSQVYSLAAGPAKTVLAGTWQGTVFATHDRGETWSEFKPRLPSDTSVWALGWNAHNGTLVAGTEGAGVFVGQYGVANPLYFPRVADGVAGSLKFRSTLVLVNGGDDTQATINFKDATGQPMAIRLNNSTARSVHTVNLKRRESVSLRTPGTDPIKSGYASVTSGPQVTGTLVFSFYANGVCMYESGVPATPAMYDASIFFDGQEPGRDVGLAVVSASDDTDAKVTFRLLDTSFRQLAVREITSIIPRFGPGYQLARYATEIFPEITSQEIKRGVVTLESDQPVAAITLRQTDAPSQAFPAEVPTMCTFPVIDRRAAEHHRWLGTDYVYFPQIANGAQGAIKFQTTLLLLNAGRTTEQVRVEFIGADGQPMTLPLKDLGQRSFVVVDVGRGHTVELQTTGQGQIQAGYARVKAPADFGGTAVFTFWENGIRLFEAGVPAVTPLRNQCVYLDNLEAGRDIGFAIANASSSASDVTLKLFDSSGVLKVTRDINPDFGGGSHLAKYASEIFPEAAQQNIKTGIIAIESKEPLAAVTLRQHGTSVPYPGDIYLLTVFPVVPLLP
ncbi:MAG: hypothetical protein EHM23_04205 [Acidobacteria bacterium]|nr:MAG: hypothetical protein EHM23_04205 [Acidobacteriota bacterium]